MNKILISLCCLLLFMNSCEKNYLDPDTVEIALFMPDTISLSTPVKIKGMINKDLKMKIFFSPTSRDSVGDMTPSNQKIQIGEFHPPVDSVVWDPSQAHLIPGKYHYFILSTSFKTSKTSTQTASDYKIIYIRQ